MILSTLTPLHSAFPQILSVHTFRQNGSLELGYGKTGKYSECVQRISDCKYWFGFSFEAYFIYFGLSLCFDYALIIMCVHVNQLQILCGRAKCRRRAS